jgi:hypothetical protein
MADFTGITIILRMSGDEIVYTMTRVYNPKTRVHYVKDSRSAESQIKCLYIGSSELCGDVEEIRVRSDVANDFLLATGDDLLFWAEILVDQIEKATSQLYIILDIGYELILQHLPTAIVQFADLMAGFCDMKGYKLVLATMTIIPELQHLKEKILEVNKEFNEVNVTYKLTPHYGVRSVMKFHKGSGTYKIRPSVWKEWRDNVGYGRTLIKEGIVTYVRYQKGYFRGGFEGTSREGDLNTRVKSQNLQLQDPKSTDARVFLSYKERMRSKVSDLTETVFDETPYLQLLLSHTPLPVNDEKDAEEDKKKERGLKRKRRE